MGHLGLTWAKHGPTLLHKVALSYYKGDHNLSRNNKQKLVVQYGDSSSPQQCKTEPTQLFNEQIGKYMEMKEHILSLFNISRLSNKNESC